MPPLGLGRDRLIDAGQPTELQPQLASPKAIAAPPDLLRHHRQRAV